MEDRVVEKRVTIAGHPFVLRNRDVVSAVETVDPEPIATHFVVVGSRRFPPKQVISQVTGLDRADFTTHHARRTLMALGFTPGRRGETVSSGRRTAAGHPGGSRDGTESARLAERLRPFIGQWVAVKDGDVLHAADTPQALVGWLAEHGQQADSMFRVPEDSLAATGFAPL